MIMNGGDNVFGERLKQARTMKGWSLRELAVATDGKVSHNALARYERGEMSPGSGILVAVAMAVQQPADFFFRSFTVNLGEISYRKRVALAGKKVKAAVEQATDFFERYCEAEELTGDIIAFKPPFLAADTISKPEDADMFADKLRMKWELGNDPIPSVVGLLERKGFKVCELELDLKMDGFSAEADGRPLVVLGQIDNKPRKRMTCVHEAAHIILPMPDDDKLEEKIAYRFAGAFLLPQEVFVYEFGKFRNRIGLSELMELKDVFGVSMMGIMVRAKQLQMISNETYVKFCKYANKPGWRKKGEPDDGRCMCDETPARFKQLVRRAVAEERITLSKGAALLKQDLNSFRKELQGMVV
jgi:Zn-dependent peptidase ImmA (M78 family)/transcriptional regulator with XRE-family HTH domain